MSYLPKGFGSGYQEPPKKKRTFRQNWHRYWDYHDDLKLALVIFIPITVLLVGAVGAIEYFYQIEVAEEMAIISQLPCEKVWDYMLSQHDMLIMKYYAGQCL